MFKPNLEALKNRVKDIQSKRSREGTGKGRGGNSANNFAVLDVGPNFLWLLPPWKDNMSDYGKFVAYHKNIPNLEGNMSSYRCRKHMAGEPCSLCETLIDLAPFVDVDGTEDYKTKMVAQFCYYVNGIKYTRVDGSFVPDRQKPYMYRLTGKTYDGVLVEIVEQEVGDISDPYDGFILRINRPETFEGKNTYEVRLNPNRMEMPIDPKADCSNDDWIKGVIDQLHDLDKIFSVPDEDTIKGAAKEMLKYFEINSGITVTENKGNPTVDESDRRVAPKPERVKETATENKEEPQPEPEIETPNSNTDEVILSIGGTDYMMCEISSDGICTLEDEDGSTMYCCEICKDKVWKSEGWVEKHIAKEHSSTPKEAAPVEADIETHKRKVAAGEVVTEAPKEEEAATSGELPVGAPTCIGKYDKCKGAKKTFCEYDNYCKKLA